MRNVFLTLSLLFSIAPGIRAQILQLVYDINSGPGGSGPTSFIAFGGKLYFAASDGIHGKELWSYDGIHAPAMVYDLNPRSSDAIISYNSNMAVLNGKLYFPANNGTSGAELFMYDGVNPPSLAADIVSGTDGSYPADLLVAGDKLYFSAGTLANGTELYTYDGSSAPVLVDINPGYGSSQPQYLTLYNGKIYFSAISSAYSIELFSYDPATNTAAMVQDISTGSDPSTPTDFTVMDNKLYFRASTAAYGWELYSYDGVSITRLTNTATHTGDGVISLGGYNGKIYFCGPGNNLNYQLYAFDPSTSKSALVSNIDPSGTSNIYNFTSCKNKLYFNGYTSAAGMEIWATDGKKTTMLADLNPGTGFGSGGSFYVWGNSLYTAANNGISGVELYRIDDSTSMENTGIQQVTFDGVVALYPNPAKNTASIDITLKAPQNIDIILQDAAGRVVYNSGKVYYTTGRNKANIPLQNLAAGNYTYSLRTPDGGLLVSGKLAKE